MNFLVASIAGFVSGMLGAMGMGGGGVLIIYLAIFLGVEQTTAQGINLIFFIPSAIIATFIYSRKKLIEWKVAIPLCILGVIGSIVGCYLSTFIQTFILRKLFGVLLLFMAIKQLKSKPNT